ncbi:MAG: hypothetical protein ACRECP_00515 [Methylocella sp.]
MKHGFRALAFMLAMIVGLGYRLSGTCWGDEPETEPSWMSGAGSSAS